MEASLPTPGKFDKKPFQFMVIAAKRRRSKHSWLFQNFELEDFSFLKKNHTAVCEACDMVSTFISTSSAIWIDGIVTYLINVVPPVQSSCLKSLTLEMNRCNTLWHKSFSRKLLQTHFPKCPKGLLIDVLSPEFVGKCSILNSAEAQQHRFLAEAAGHVP